MSKWTPELVKEKLPDVPVKLGCKTLVGTIRGRNLPEATVSVSVPCRLCEPPRCRSSYVVERQVSWKTLAVCLSEKSGAIRFD